MTRLTFGLGRCGALVGGGLLLTQVVRSQAAPARSVVTAMIDQLHDAARLHGHQRMGCGSRCLDQCGGGAAAATGPPASSSMLMAQCRASCLSACRDVIEYQSSVVSVVQRHMAIFDHPEIPSTVSQFQAGLSDILAELSQLNLYSYVLTTTGVGVRIGESGKGDCCCLQVAESNPPVP